jgi:hypothetical protein
MTIPSQAGLANHRLQPGSFVDEPLLANGGNCEEAQQKDGDWNRDRDETVQHSQSELVSKNIPLDRPRMCFMSRLYEAGHGILYPGRVIDTLQRSYLAARSIGATRLWSNILVVLGIFIGLAGHQRVVESQMVWNRIQVAVSNRSHT